MASWSSGNSASPLIKLCSGNGWNAKIQRGSTPSVLPDASSFNRWIKHWSKLAAIPINLSLAKALLLGFSSS